MKEQILSSITEIRKYINAQYKFNELLQNKKKFNICCSSMDVLEDTTEAIYSYKNGIFPTELGLQYLYIHGLFQALFVQQDALSCLNKELLNSTEINFETTYPEIYKIREVRNDITGHPTNRKNKYSTFLTRITLNKNKLSYFQNTENHIENYDIINAIDTQEKFLYDFLEDNILNKLKEQESQYYEKYINNKLSNIFDNKYLYAFEKLDGDDTQFHYSLKELSQLINILKDKVNERFVDWQQTDFKIYITKIEENISYLSTRLEEVYRLIDFNDYEQIKNTYISNLRYLFEDLEKYTKDIDKEYEDYFLTEESMENTEIPEIKANAELVEVITNV